MGGLGCGGRTLKVLVARRAALPLPRCDVTNLANQTHTGSYTAPHKESFSKKLIKLFSLFVIESPPHVALATVIPRHAVGDPLYARCAALRYPFSQDPVVHQIASPSSYRRHPSPRPLHSRNHGCADLQEEEVCRRRRVVRRAQRAAHARARGGGLLRRGSPRHALEDRGRHPRHPHPVRPRREGPPHSRAHRRRAKEIRLPRKLC